MANQIRPIWTLPIGAPSNTDIIYMVEDPDGTPLERKITLSALASFIGGGGGGGGIDGTIAANQVAFGTGADTIGGNDNFTFNSNSGISITLPPASDSYNYAINITGNPASDLGSYPGIYGINILLDANDSTIADATGIKIKVVGASDIASNFNVGLLLDVDRSAGTGANGFVAGIWMSPISDSTGLSTVHGMKIGTVSGGSTNAYGIEIGTISGATNNYAIKTNGGWVTLGSLPTSAAGLPSGTLWNLSGVVQVA